MGIGKTLLELLTENNTNANELAKKIDVSPNTLYSIIKRDNMKVDISVLIKIADALGVPAEYFYDKRTSGVDVLSKREKTLIKKYRALDERGKKAVDDTANSQLESMEPSAAGEESNAKAV